MVKILGLRKLFILCGVMLGAVMWRVLAQNVCDVLKVGTDICIYVLL
jgi:hypothetical protein